MDEYGNLKRELLASASGATQSSMEQELKEIGTELQQSKQAVLNFQASNNVVFLQPSGGNNAADYLSYLTRELDKERSELEQLSGLTLDENLERQQGLLNQQPTPTTVSNKVPKADAVPGVENVAQKKRRQRPRR